VQSISSEVPTETKLFQNYPNPFNPITTIKYQIAKNSFVKLTIYDLLGREVQTLVNEKQSAEGGAGTYQVNWDASNFASGVYFYKLTTQTFSNTRKLVLIK
jgi:hypothetical protein